MKATAMKKAARKLSSDQYLEVSRKCLRSV